MGTSFRGRGSAALLVAMLAGTADGQSFPSQPIHIVVPFAAGGSVITHAKITVQ